MKALVHTAAYRFELKEVATPVPGPCELLVRIKAVGICGSDIHGATGKTGRRKPPVIMGHEAAGVVEEIGREVLRFKKGDRITFDSTISCGRCSFCKAGRINLCDQRMVFGVSCDDYKRDGAMAEYLVVPENIAYHIPESLSFPEACMVEAVSIAMHAVHRAPFNIGDRCAVVGTGLIGLLIIPLLKGRGCGDLIGFDINDGRLEMAKKSGADEVVNLSKNERLQEKYFDTIDAVIEAVGIGETILTAINLVRKGGIITVVGNLSPLVEFPLQRVVTKEISFNGACASCGEYPASIQWISSGKLNVKPLISRIAPLEDGVKHFDILIHKKEDLFKVILEP